MPFEYFNPLPHLAKYKSFEELLSKQDIAEIDDLCRKIRVMWTSEDMTPNQRIQGARLGQDIDRVPCIIQMPRGIGMKKIGANYIDIYQDPVKCIKVTLHCILEIKMDGGRQYAPIDMSLSDVFGTKWEFLPDSLPKVTEWAVKRGFEDILESPLPDPRQSEALRWALETMRFLNEKLGDLSSFSGNIPYALGPYYMYNSCLRGPIKGFSDIKKYPDLAVETFDKLRDYIIDLLKYQMEAAGSQSWKLIESLAAPDYTSPAWFEKYCAPYNRRIIEALAPAPGTVAGGGQGQTDFTPLLDTYAEMGFKGFSFGPPTDLKRMKEIGREKGVFLAHWAMTQPLMRWGSPQEVSEHVKECIRIAAPGKGYMLTTDIPDDDSPLENLLAITDGCKKYGKYPLRLDGG